MLEYYLFKFVLFFNQFILFYTMAMTAFSLLQFLFSSVGTARYLQKTRIANIAQFRHSRNLVPMSILVPAYNERDVIAYNVQSLLNINYATYEVIVINDGSVDDTLQQLIEMFHLQPVDVPINRQLPTQKIRGVYKNPDFPLLTIIDKENGGKADALNAGINASKYPYFVSLDADSVLDSDALIRITMSFMEQKHTVAVGGIVRIINGSVLKEGHIHEIKLPKKAMANFQIVEYLRAFLVGRMWLTGANALMIISGAFGAFKKDVVLEAGGYATDTVGEDMELVLRLHRLMHQKKYKYSINFMPDPVCWTQAPENVKDLFSQRRRWHVGLRDSIRKNAAAFLNPRFGMMGLIGMPYYVIFELFGCLIEGLGFVVMPLSYLFGLMAIDYFLLFLVFTQLFGIIISIGALALEEFTFNKYAKLSEFFKLSFYSIAENFFYRQMITFFRIVGLLFFRKYRKAWASLKRQTTQFEQQPWQKGGQNIPVSNA